MAKSNWNKLTTWYSGMVGTSGHKHHRHVMPTLLKLLDPKTNESILDIGCGTGILTPYITKTGARYVGIDLSEKMIQEARKFNKEQTFFVGSADKLTKHIKQKFNKAVFLLSIQDMDPLDKIITETKGILTKDGILVLLILHPAFRIPRQSGWGNDKNRKITFRRMDRYISENVIPLDTNIKEKGKNIKSYFYHRPIQKYVEVLNSNGFVISDFVEIADPKDEFKEFPMFLAMKCLVQNHN